jgi:hypothetical protein
MTTQDNTFRGFNNLKLEVEDNKYGNFLTQTEFKLFEYFVSRRSDGHFSFNTRRIAEDYERSYNQCLVKSLKKDFQSLLTKKFDLSAISISIEKVEYKINLINEPLIIEVDENENSYHAYKINDKLMYLITDNVRFTQFHKNAFKIGNKNSQSGYRAFILYRYICDLNNRMLSIEYIMKQLNISEKYYSSNSTLVYKLIENCMLEIESHDVNLLNHNYVYDGIATSIENLPNRTKSHEVKIEFITKKIIK